MFAPNLAGVAAAREEITQRALSAESIIITQQQAAALGMVGLNPSDLNKFENCGKGNDSRDSRQMVVPGGTLKLLKRNRILPKTLLLVDAVGNLPNRYALDGVLGPNGLLAKMKAELPLSQTTLSEKHQAFRSRSNTVAFIQALHEADFADEKARVEGGVALQAHVVDNLLYLAERLKDLSGEVATAEAACKQHSSGAKSGEAISARKVLSDLTSERASLTTLRKLLHKDLILALGAGYVFVESDESTLREICREDEEFVSKTYNTGVVEFSTKIIDNLTRTYRDSLEAGQHQKPPRSVPSLEDAHQWIDLHAEYLRAQQRLNSDVQMIVEAALHELLCDLIIAMKASPDARCVILGNLFEGQKRDEANCLHPTAAKPINGSMAAPITSIDHVHERIANLIGDFYLRNEDETRRMDAIISHAPSNVNLTRVHLARLANLDGAKFRGKGPGLQSVLDRVTSLGSNFDFDSLMTTGAVGSLNNENNGPDNGGFSHDARGGRGPLPKKSLNDLDASLLKNLNESQQEYIQLVIRQIADRTGHMVWFKKGVIYTMAGGDAHKRTVDVSPSYDELKNARTTIPKATFDQQSKFNNAVDPKRKSGKFKFDINTADGSPPGTRRPGPAKDGDLAGLARQKRKREQDKNKGNSEAEQKKKLEERLAASQSEMAALKAQLAASKQAAGFLASIGQGQQQQNATVGDSLADLVADEEAKRLVREAVNASAVNAIDHGAEEEEDRDFFDAEEDRDPVEDLFNEDIGNVSPLTVEGEGNEDPGNIASLNTPSTSSHLRVQHITNITNMKALLAPVGSYRAFALNMNPLSRKSRRMVLLDTGAGLKEKGLLTKRGFNELDKEGQVIYSVMVATGQTLRPFTGKATHVIGTCLARLTFCVVPGEQVFGDAAVRITDTSAAPAGADLVTVDWLFDIVDIGSPDIIVGPSILAMSGINIRNYRKNGETITAGVLEFNTLMNMNPTGDVINFLLSGKPVEGLRIHNEAALRQCLQRIPLTTGLSALISKSKMAQQSGATSAEIKAIEQELGDAVAAFRASAPRGNN